MSQVPTEIPNEHLRRSPPLPYDELHWYACYTRGRHEKRVAALLEERGIESYLPLIQQQRQWKDRRTIVALPAFPSYVFGRFMLRDLRTIYTTYGVASVVRNQGYPTPIPDEELEQVRLLIERAANSGEQPELANIEKGEPVQIVEGPFRGVQGVVVQKRGSYRVLVGLQAIGHGLSIEVELRHLSRSAANSHCGVPTE